MVKEDFIEFIKELGFAQTWGSNSNSFSLSTDVMGKPNQNLMAFADQLKISIDDELVQLSLSQMSERMPYYKIPHMMAGLKTFGDDGDIQLELFLSFILGSFNQKPKHILQFIRDRKIKNILQ